MEATRIFCGLEQGWSSPEPVTHEFCEGAYYIDGEMYNAGTGKTIKGGTYVFHSLASRTDLSDA